MSSQSNRSHVTLNTLADRKRNGVKFAALTAYDALFAELISSAGVEVILVGDSLGMVLQGHDSTLPVTLDDMVYHMNCVHRGNRGALIMADLPFMSYASERQSLKSAATLMRAGAHIVKLEGGAWLAESSRLLTERGIPVCAHMGLTPQSINRIGGYRVQGRDPDQAHAIIEEALVLEEAGASILLLECVPVELATPDLAAAAHTDHRHRCGATYRRPDHGDARHARYHAAFHQGAEVHQELSRRKPQLESPALSKRMPMRCAAACFLVRNTRSTDDADSGEDRRRSRCARRPIAPCASGSCRRWAICTMVISRW